MIYIARKQCSKITLEVACVGINPQTISANGQTVFNIVIEDDKSALNELVVTGHQTMSISLSGGTQTNRYITTLNYLEKYGNQKFQKNKRIGFRLKGDINFFKWLSSDIRVAGSFYRKSGDIGVQHYADFMPVYPGYYLLEDEAAKHLPESEIHPSYSSDRIAFNPNITLNKR